MSTSTLLKGVAVTMIILLILFGVTMCATKSQSVKRGVKDIESEFGGLNRTIKVYTANGDVIAEYKGKIDIKGDSNGEVKFEYQGKRYIYYNCFVETIEE